MEGGKKSRVEIQSPLVNSVPCVHDQGTLYLKKKGGSVMQKCHSVNVRKNSCKANNKFVFLLRWRTVSKKRRKTPSAHIFKKKENQKEIATLIGK